MKLSTIFIITAAVVSLGMLTAYNFSLKASYQKGGYKDRFNEMEFSSVKGLTAVQINAANKFAINIEKGGKEGLWIKDGMKDLVKISQVGSTLTIDLTDEAKERNFNTNDDDIILFSNTLSTISTVPYFTKEEEEEGGWRHDGGDIRIKGLSVDALNLHIGKFTSIYMNHVKTGMLKATVGEVGPEEAGLTVDSSNEIAFADLSVPGKSKISLLNPKIVKTRYNLSDSATVTLNGAALEGMKK
jgi:hypothetical protein